MLLPGKQEKERKDRLEERVKTTEAEEDHRHPWAWRHEFSTTLVSVAVWSSLGVPSSPGVTEEEVNR